MTDSPNRVLKNPSALALGRDRIEAAGGVMRGSDEGSGALFSYVDLEARVPARHPLRTIRGDCE